MNIRVKKHCDTIFFKIQCVSTILFWCGMFFAPSLFHLPQLLFTDRCILGLHLGLEESLKNLLAQNLSSGNSRYSLGCSENFFCQCLQDRCLLNCMPPNSVSLDDEGMIITQKSFSMIASLIPILAAVLRNNASQSRAGMVAIFLILLLRKFLL